MAFIAESKYLEHCHVKEEAEMFIYIDDKENY